jgi:hypothetical protein
MINAYTECPKCSEELCKYGKCHACDGCDTHAEQQYDRWLEDYYGGDSPQTDRERLEVSWKEFKQ